MVRTLFLILAGVYFLNAQYINIKSLPVVTGDQHIIFPSKNIAMGDVNIALTDPWKQSINDPAFTYFSEPGFDLFIHPAFYTITNSLGSARSIPISAFAGFGTFFGYFSATFQQIESAHTSNNGIRNFQNGSNALFNDRIKDNRYLAVSAGTKLPNSGLSIGAGLFYSKLNATGGVDLLYANARSINQDGEVVEFRTGLCYQNSGSTLEIIALFNDFEMLHQVTYNEWIWAEGDNEGTVPDYLKESNLDKTQTYGFGITYREKIKEGPSIAAAVNYNWKSHPKIPNYSVMNIPRDPGNTHAFNFGVGIGMDNEKTKTGLDFIYEPVWSNTWAAAEEDIRDANNNLIKAGQKTVENYFTFNNWLVRVGYNRKYSLVNWSVGLQMLNNSYSLIQDNYINISSRSQQEKWLEYIWSWGLEIEFKYFSFNYNGRITTGSGIPNIVFNSWNRLENGPLDSGGFIAAPSGKLEIDYQSVYTHQFIFRVPLDVHLF